jgi:hypothetical protein
MWIYWAFTFLFLLRTSLATRKDSTSRRLCFSTQLLSLGRILVTDDGLTLITPVFAISKVAQFDKGKASCFVT